MRMYYRAVYRSPWDGHEWKGLWCVERRFDEWFHWPQLQEIESTVAWSREECPE
jgi:hypothetical protein